MKTGGNCITIHLLPFPYISSLFLSCPLFSPTLPSYCNPYPPSLCLSIPTPREKTGAGSPPMFPWGEGTATRRLLSYTLLLSPNSFFSYFLCLFASFHLLSFFSSLFSSPLLFPSILTPSPLLYSTLPLFHPHLSYLLSLLSCVLFSILH